MLHSSVTLSSGVIQVPKSPKSMMDKRLEQYLAKHPIPLSAFDQAKVLHEQALSAFARGVDFAALTSSLLVMDDDALELLFRFCLHGSARQVSSSIIEASNDHRSRPWRVRVMLFDEHDDLQADEGGEQGEHYEPAGDGPVLHGLAGVASHIAVLACGYHGECPEALKPQALIKKIPSLRPTLSRNDGRVAWRVEYQANGKPWLMRCEIRKAVAI